MAKSLQFRRGNTSQTLANTMASGELFVNTDQGTIVVGDGLTPGGNPLATQNQLTANVATLNASLAANVAGLVTQSQLSANVATLNNSIASVSCGLTQCFNSKISCSGGVTLSGATVCSSVECNLTLAGTLTMNGSTGSTGQVLCSTGTGVGWGSGGSAGAAYFQSSGSNLLFCPITTPGKTTASCNIGLGVCSLFGLSSGCNNVAIGTYSLRCNTICHGNIAIGKSSLGTATGANKSIAIGYGAACATATNPFAVSIAIGMYAACVGTHNFDVAIGYMALCGTGGNSTSNIAIGKRAMSSLGTSSMCNNVAIGTYALTCNCNANCNVAIGYMAARCQCTGCYSISIGTQAGRYIASNFHNINIGRNAGRVAQFGACNTSIGSNSGSGNFTTRSVTIGFYAGSGNGHYCSVMIGLYAGRSSCSRNSVAIGTKASYATLHSFCKDVSIGYYAHKGANSNTTCNNVAIGTCALVNNCTGFCNIAIGYCAGSLICSGSNNVILGPYTGSSTLNCTVVINAGTCQRLKANTGGLYVNGTLLSGGGGGSAAYCKSLNNSVFAPASCNSSLSTCLGRSNILMGLCAGYCIVSTGNIAIGAYAGKNLCTTSQNGRNIFIGYKASCSGCSSFGRQVIIGGYAAQTNAGYSNVILGFGALSCTGTQTCAVRQSVAIGTYAMAQGVPGNCGGTTTGSIAIGFKSGIFCGTNCMGISCAIGNINIGMYSSFGQTTTTWQNTVIGQCAGWTLNGSQNTILGMGAGGCSSCVTNISGTNNTLLGYNAQPLSGTCSNTITLGNSQITTIRAQTTTITSLSDYRDKAYIETLPVGLEFLRQVRPVTFTWKMRDGSKVGQKEAGFIAQELEAVTNNSTIKDWLDGIVISNEDRSRLEAAPGKMLPLIVKAIQELAAENDSLKARVTALEAAINK